MKDGMSNRDKCIRILHLQYLHSSNTYCVSKGATMTLYAWTPLLIQGNEKLFIKKERVGVKETKDEEE